MSKRQDWARSARRLCALLPLAVVLPSRRSTQELSPISLRVDRRRVERQRLDLRFPTGWLEQHPLTRADLELEARLLRKAGFELFVQP